MLLTQNTAVAAKLLQSCPTLCDPIDGSPLGSSVPGILQARTLEWVAISFSNAWKWKVKVKSLSRAWVLATPWTAAYQAPPSMGFSRQEYWSGVPLPSPEHYNTIWSILYRTDGQSAIFFLFFSFFFFVFCLFVCLFVCFRKRRQENLGLPQEIVIGYQSHADTATKSGSTTKNRFFV